MEGVVDDLCCFFERHNRPERQRMFEILQRPPFHPLPLDQHMHIQQEHSWKSLCAVAELGLLDVVRPIQPTQHEYETFWARLECAVMHDMALGTLIGAHIGLCAGAIMTMGTDDQHEQYLPDLYACERRGCFAMTELGHGSNVRDLETTAHFDVATQEFVINTPRDSAQKFWIGNAVGAHLAVVMAQLYTNGVCHGVHGFVVPMRDAHNHLYPGVRVADVGHKMGLNGNPNGRIWFNKVRIPADNLLRRYGSVAEDGSYSSFISDSNLRFSICLAELLRGRIAIILASSTNSRVCLGTAISYALSRRQFRVGDAEETLLLDYPMHQRRLLPHLAMTYAMYSPIWRVQVMWNDRSDDITVRMQQMKEIHIMTSGFKSLGGWFARDAMQAAREACGGQGYASWNHISRFKADFDASLTYEGDNCVLMALGTRTLMKMYRKGLKDRKFPSTGLLFHMNGLAMSDIQALDLGYPVVWREGPLPAGGRFEDATSWFDASLLRHPVFLLTCLQVRENLYLNLLSKRLQQETMKAGNLPQADAEETAWNACGSLAMDCGRAFFERLTMQWFLDDIRGVVKLEATRNLLSKLASLFGLWLVLGDARFCGTSALSVSRQQDMRQEFDTLLGEVRVHAHTLVQGMAVPEFFLGPIATSGDSNDKFWSYEQTLKNTTYAGRAKL